MPNEEQSIDRVMSGRIWEEFCDNLKAAGAEILRPETPANPFDRAEGWRFLTRLTRIALEMMVERSDPDYPTFYNISSPTVKIGADNPDNIYHAAIVRGDRDYRISGKRGSAPFVSFGAKSNRYGEDGTMMSGGEIDAGAMAFAPDGSFELILSQKPHPGNWLPMGPHTDLIAIRETFLDREKTNPSVFRIECLNRPPAPAPLTPAKLDQALTAAAKFVRGTAHTFINWTEIFRTAPNALPDRDQAMFQNAGGDPKIYYIHGYWELEPGQALVIHTKVPKCTVWNFQVDNYWMESLEYRYQQIWTNNHLAKYNPDGSVTLIIAAEDPGVGNWLDTTGHARGTSLLRWVGAETFPIPVCRVASIESLRAQAAKN